MKRHPNKVTTLDVITFKLPKWRMIFPLAVSSISAVGFVIGGATVAIDNPTPKELAYAFLIMAAGVIAMLFVADLAPLLKKDRGYVLFTPTHLIVNMQEEKRFAWGEIGNFRLVKHPKRARVIGFYKFYMNEAHAANQAILSDYESFPVSNFGSPDYLIRLMYRYKQNAML